MKYNFDTHIDRYGTDCEKYESLKAIFGREDLIPLWVADTDFAVGDFILDAIKQRMEHPILGYSFRSEDYHKSIQGWVRRHGKWDVELDWLAFSPGVVAGVTFAMLSCTDKGHGVVNQPPVYHPFAHAIRLNDREIVNNPLVFTPDGYRLDFEDLDQKLAQAKALILCNPHNPTGRVFTKEELLKIGELCKKHDITIISDEIHSDFVYSPNQHLHIAALNDDLAQRTITLIAPSKSFNVAGLSTSVAIIPNPERMAAFKKEVDKIHINNGNIFGAIALEAAYTAGDQWMSDLLAYLQSNIRFIQSFLAENLPSVTTYHPEATFLMWLDFRQWGMDQEALNRFLIEEAGLGLSDGTIFGQEGKGFQRLNVGTTRATLEKAMNQLLAAAQKIGKA